MRFPYIGREMFDQAQVLYLEEVLGGSVNYFRVSASDFATGAGPKDTILVLTPRLSGEEKSLLSKILASIKITDHRHEELASLAENTLSAANVLAFFGSGSREDRPSSRWWNLPALNEMTGHSPSVAETKKSAWTILQQFAKEAL